MITGKTAYKKMSELSKKYNGNTNNENSSLFSPIKSCCTIW